MQVLFASGSVIYNCLFYWHQTQRLHRYVVFLINGSSSEERIQELVLSGFDLCVPKTARFSQSSLSCCWVHINAHM